MIVSDGGTGFLSAKNKVWPNTLYQRCLFHVYCQIKRYTTSRPNLLAGSELLALARELLYINTLHDAHIWCDKFIEWNEFWQDFLDEKSFIDGKYTYTHIRLRKAQSALWRAIRKECLFKVHQKF